jgi:hypothetical protein
MKPGAPETGFLVAAAGPPATLSLGFYATRSKALTSPTKAIFQPER